MEGELIYKFPAENGDEIERRFFFGNYALEQTLAELNISVNEISEALNKSFLLFFRLIIFHAAAYPILKEGKEPDFKPFDVHDWIDRTGGLQGDFFKRASDSVYKGLGMSEEEQQKKSKPKN